MASEHKDSIVENEENEDYWCGIYRNIARADVNRAQIKQSMFVYSKVKKYAGMEDRSIRETMSSGL